MKLPTVQFYPPFCYSLRSKRSPQLFRIKHPQRVFFLGSQEGKFKSHKSRLKIIVFVGKLTFVN
jgi:hypothetical protein